MKRLIVGCGYLGERVARRWREAGHEVAIVTRSREHADRFRNQGFIPIVADVTQPATLGQFVEIEAVLYSVGYDRTARQSILDVYAGGVKNVFAALPSSV